MYWTNKIRRICTKPISDRSKLKLILEFCKNQDERFNKKWDKMMERFYRVKEDGTS